VIDYWLIGHGSYLLRVSVQPGDQDNDIVSPRQMRPQQTYPDKVRHNYDAICMCICLL